MSDASLPPSWRVLLRPQWLSWHLFAVAAVAGMIWLGDWQFRRAMAGNTLSWAYTFEWPIFAIFGVVFWAKTIRDELHPSAEAEVTEVSLPSGAGRSGTAHGARPDGGGPDGACQAAEDSQDGGQKDTGPADAELAEYNAYLAKLGSQVKGHGRWHGFR
jgi:hypothetical protein